jgi:hypothetical protein
MGEALTSVHRKSIVGGVARPRARRAKYLPLALGVILCAMGSQVHAARSLRVRGTARFDGHAGRSHGRLLLEGRVLDDAGSPVPGAAVSLGARSTTPGAAAAVDLANVVSPCGQDRPIAAVRTDESGRYCVWIAVPVGAYALHVEAAATPWLTKASVDYAVDLAKRSVKLRFDPEPRVVSLDARDASLEAVATYDDDDGAGGAGASGLPLVLTTETVGATAPEVVARATTGAGGRATFVLAAASLGPPGRGTLEVRFDGNADTMASEHVAPIERDAHVALALVRAPEPSSPEDGVAIDVATSVRGAPGRVATGTVEARFEGTVVGAATLDDHGRATLRGTFAAPRGAKTADLLLRYVPDAPWLQPAGEIAATVPIRPPSPLRQLPLAIGALAVAAWLLVGRSARRQRLDRTIVMQHPPTHEGTAGIAMVHSSRSRTGTYSGRVVDAHDGTPVGRARVSVQNPSFGGDSVLASVFADERGAFAFELESAPPGAELVVEAPLHADLRQKLPGAGVLEIALVSRKRKLLERLVHWAKRRGPPFDARPEPTPAQVRRAAERAMPAGGRRDEGAEQIRKWADAVEQAAFDRGVVDARAEADVMALDPDERNGRRAPRGPGGAG